MKRLLRPPLPVFAGIVITAAALLTLCLNGTVQAAAVGYFAYLYSTYALAALCVRMPGWVRRARSALAAALAGMAEKNRSLGAAYDLLTDDRGRARALLVPSLLFNLVYAAVKLGSGIWLGSEWLMGIGAYYTILSGLRYSLLRTFLRDRKGTDAERDWRAYRATAIWLMLLTLVMSGIIIQEVYFDRAYHYPGSLIYAFALYAFVKIITALSALLRRRRDDNRLLASSRCVSFACALMSMLALQTAMLSQFGENDAAFARSANTLFGIAVCVIMLAICLTMLVNYARNVRKR